MTNSALSTLIRFRQLSEESARLLARRMVPQRCRKGSFITTPHQKAEYVFFIISGNVTFIQSHKGKRVIMETLCPGDMFGDFRFAEKPNITYSSFAKCDQNCELLKIKVGNLLKLTETRPDICRGLILELTERLFLRESRLADVAIRMAQDRILNELQRLSSATEKHSIRKVARMTHEYLAERLGLTRETVTKVFGELKGRGIIEISKRYILVHLEKL